MPLRSFVHFGGRGSAALTVVITLLSLAPMSAWAQQQEVEQQQAPAKPDPARGQYVGHFLIYTGFMFLDSPVIGLFEPGIHFQAGMRWSRHVSVGFDYSRSTGDATIGLAQTTTSLQNLVNPLLAGLKAGGILPQNYVPVLPISSVTQTFTAGPEFPYRRWNRITPYIRPALGAIYEVATARPPDYVTKLLVTTIAPTGMKTDWTYFYGFGGGCAFNITKHFSMVVQADFVHDHLFPDLLQTGRNTVRFSIGPGVQFGRNVTRPWL